MDTEKRDRIIDAAARAFARVGFKKASVDDIARAAGVAKGTVYLHCKNKEDLFFQAVHRDLRRWLGHVAERIDPRIPADTLLGDIAIASLAYLESHPLARDLIVGIFHGQLPGWFDRFEALRSLAHANIVEILRLGGRQGCLRDDIDVEAVASILQDVQLAGYASLMRKRRGRRGDIDQEATTKRARAALDLILNGLRPRYIDSEGSPPRSR